MRFLLCTALTGSFHASGLATTLMAQEGSQQTPQIFTGKLEEDSDSFADEIFTYHYENQEFKGIAGKTIVIDLISNDFDAYLILLGPSGQQIVYNDDGPDSTNSRIVITLPVTGIYTMVIRRAPVTKFEYLLGTVKPEIRYGVFGDYRLELWLATTEVVQRLTNAIDLNQQAFELYQVGRYSEAVPLIESALVVLNQELGPKHPDISTIFNNLGLLYLSLGRTEDALGLFQEAIFIYEEQLGVPSNASNLLDHVRLIGFSDEIGDSITSLRRSLELPNK